MTQFKTLAYGAILSLTCGLSACTLLDDPYYDRPADYDAHRHTHQQHTARGAQQNTDVVVSNNAPAAHKASSSKEPLQKSTPGPKRAAAPQIPVLEQ